MADLEKLKQVLEEKGFQEVKADDGTKLESEYEVDTDFLKNLDTGEKKYRIRKIRWQNEWHDEELTQIQIVVTKDKIGLGSLLGLAEDLLGFYLNREISLEVKTEYIRNIVPGIELLLEGKRVAGGGFIENKEKQYQAVVLTLIKERL